MHDNSHCPNKNYHKHARPCHKNWVLPMHLHNDTVGKAMTEKLCVRTHGVDTGRARWHGRHGGGISPGLGERTLCDGSAQVFTPATLQRILALQAVSTAFVHRTGTRVETVHLQTQAAAAPASDIADTVEGTYVLV